jgi:hypothetical protein
MRKLIQVMVHHQQENTVKREGDGEVMVSIQTTIYLLTKVEMDDFPITPTINALKQVCKGAFGPLPAPINATLLPSTTPSNSDEDSEAGDAFHQTISNTIKILPMLPNPIPSFFIIPLSTHHIILLIHFTLSCSFFLVLTALFLLICLIICFQLLCMGRDSKVYRVLNFLMVEMGMKHHTCPVKALLNLHYSLATYYVGPRKVLKVALEHSLDANNALPPKTARVMRKRCLQCEVEVTQEIARKREKRHLREWREKMVQTWTTSP